MIIKLDQSAIESTPCSSKVSYVSGRDPLLEKIEKTLRIRIYHFQKGVPLSGLAIRNKGLQLYKNLHQVQLSVSDKVSETQGEQPIQSFQASQRWFNENFKVKKVNKYVQLTWWSKHQE